MNDINIDNKNVGGDSIERSTVSGSTWKISIAAGALLTFLGSLYAMGLFDAFLPEALKGEQKVIEEMEQVPAEEQADTRDPTPAE